MKRLTAIGVCIFFLLALFAYAQNETENNTAKQPKAAANSNCNNDKKPDVGENCFTCPSDVKCKSGQGCNEETAKCETIINFTTYIILGIGALLFIGIIIFARRFMFKKREEEQKPFSQPSFQQPVQQQVQSMQMPPETISSNAAENVQPQQAQEPQQQEQAERLPETAEEYPGETQSQKFIRQMRKKGLNDERIRMKMKEAGWNDTQIALEFIKAPKFVKKP